MKERNHKQEELNISRPRSLIEPLELADET